MAEHYFRKVGTWVRFPPSALLIPSFWKAKARGKKRFASSHFGEFMIYYLKNMPDLTEKIEQLQKRLLKLGDCL